VRPSSDGYSIRPARADDLAALPRIERVASQLFRETEYAVIADEAEWEVARFEEWFREGAIWVAVDAASEIVGFAVAEEIDGQGFLTELDVLPEHGRRGLGRRLIEAVCAWAVARGYKALQLSTFRNVLWNAPYYARLGFRIVEEAQWGPGLRAIREGEAEGGMDVAARVFMALPLEGRDSRL
jgi:GNAT superfamily N-acetyltransferase